MKYKIEIMLYHTDTNVTLKSYEIDDVEEIEYCLNQLLEILENLDDPEDYEIVLRLNPYEEEEGG